MEFPEETLPQIANRVVSFPQAARWAGIRFWGDTRERGSKVHCPFGLLHPDQGRERAFRVYSDHGYCFAERRRFTAVSLLAAYWELSWKDAAKKALDLIGYVPAGYAQEFENAQKPPEPDRRALAVALAEWCRANCSDWSDRQYHRVVAGQLSRCLGLLPLVKTEGDCARWLEGCQQAMAPYLTLVKSSPTLTWKGVHQ